DRAPPQGHLLVGNDQILVDMLLDAEPAAGRTGAIGIVKGEQPRLDFGNSEAGYGAGKLFPKQDPFGAALVLDLFSHFLFVAFSAARARRAGSVRVFDPRKPLGELERGLKTLGQPLTNVRPHHDAVDHDIDVVRKLLVERRSFGELIKDAVDLDPLKSLLQVLGKLLAVLALAAAHDRRKQIKPRAFSDRQHAVDHL